MTQIETLRIRPFVLEDGFRLMVPVGRVRGAGKEVRIEGEYQTNAGGSLCWKFEGPFEDARPVKEFLDRQIRAAKDSDVKIEMMLTFNQGLSLEDKGIKKLTEGLTKLAHGAAQVTATGSKED